MAPKKKQKTFDWSCARSERFLLKLSYIGTNYFGNAWQDKTIVSNSNFKTVEQELFDALVRMHLIEDRTKCNFSRCGRTDKGVHALGNYVTLDLRLKPGKNGEEDQPYPYQEMLNRMLPADIRILGIVRAPRCFDARFHCLYRVYKYYFLKEPGLDIEHMRVAAQQFLGEHDFRNFCKMDLETTTNHVRRMVSVEFREIPGPIPVIEVTIAGLSFLYHQIRCMMAILFLIGRRLEDPSIIPQLLDVEKNPEKPLYELADESGLVLYDCYFEGIHLDTPGPTSEAVASFREMYCHSLKMSTIYGLFGGSLDVLETPEPKKYTKLLDRPKTATLEKRVEQMQQRQARKQPAEQ